MDRSTLSAVRASFGGRSSEAMFRSFRVDEVRKILTDKKAYNDGLHSVDQVKEQDAMTRGDEICKLPVQDPPGAEFSSSCLTWSKIEGDNHTVDDVALIPFSRVEDFLKGESDNVECPTRFHIERGRKRVKDSLKKRKIDEYLEYRLYWCSFGPENYREGGTVLPSRMFRTGGRRRAIRPQSMRGCTCHFTVKRLYARPSVALIIYNQRQHVDKTGSVCHGPLDRDAIGPRAMHLPYVPNELRQQTMSMIYLGISEECVLQKHIEGVEMYGGPSSGDDDLACKYVQKLEKVIKWSTYELDSDDILSIRMWVERHPKNVFFFQDSSDTNSFVLGIQTEWQLEQMIRLGNNSLVAADTTFGIKKLKYPLYTLLVFDSNQHAFPVAWVITRSFASDDVNKWMGSLQNRLQAKDPTWRLNGFTVDDAATEIATIRDVFQCPVLLSLWRVRRAWLKNVSKKCNNIKVRREMFKRLGHIMYSTWNGADSVDAISEFMQDFVDQSAFLKYFKARWLPKIEMWLAAMRILPLASQEMCGAIESYHTRLKSRLFNELDIGAYERVDWLVHKLTTEVHSCYWFDQYAEERGFFGNIRDEYIISTSWQRALQIPDTDVILNEEDLRYAKVVSQRDFTQTHVVWNPGSDFALCDCSWSMLGNLCKHVIKVNIVCHNRRMAQPSMAFQTYHQVLLSLWQNLTDDSVGLDHATSLAICMQQDLTRLVEAYNYKGVSSLVDALSLKWIGKRQRTHKRRATADEHFDLMGKKVVATQGNGWAMGHKNAKKIKWKDHSK